jgi:hypothetical protein
LAAVAQQVTSETMASNRPKTRWVTSIQSGFADTFQLTLGGMFGEGPAWQTRITTGWTNVARAGDTLFIYGWDTHDTPSHSNDYQAGIGYKSPVWRRGSQSLSLGTGFQHWRFPSVKTGTMDWLVPGNLMYQAKAGTVPLIVTSDSWTLLSSPLPAGTLLHTQAWVEHPLIRHDAMKVVFRHGPAHTYSWNFYGTNGNRVLRYQTMVIISFGFITVDGGWRKQWGQQPGIQKNQYWQFSVTRTFTR